MPARSGKRMGSTTPRFAVKPARYPRSSLSRTGTAGGTCPVLHRSQTGGSNRCILERVAPVCQGPRLRGQAQSHLLPNSRTPMPTIRVTINPPILLVLPPGEYATRFREPEGHLCRAWRSGTTVSRTEVSARFEGQEDGNADAQQRARRRAEAEPALRPRQPSSSVVSCGNNPTDDPRINARPSEPVPVYARRNRCRVGRNSTT